MRKFYETNNADDFGCCSENILLTTAAKNMTVLSVTYMDMVGPLYSSYTLPFRPWASRFS